MKLGFLGIVLGAALLPPPAHADEYDEPYAPPAPPLAAATPPPESYMVHDTWSAPVFVTGALTFAGSYAVSVIIASTSDNAAAERLYLPLAGPWLALDEWGDCPILELRCDSNTTAKVLLVADGVFQAVGAITMLASVVSPSARTVVATRPAKLSPKIGLKPTPRGLAVAGQF